MKKLIVWAVIGMFLFLTFRLGIGFLIGWFLTFLVIKFITWFADWAGYNRASGNSEWYGKTQIPKRLLQTAEPNKLEKLTSSHKFGRCELTYDFKNYYVFEGGRAWHEDRSQPKEDPMINTLKEMNEQTIKNLVDFGLNVVAERRIVGHYQILGKAEPAPIYETVYRLEEIKDIENELETIAEIFDKELL